MPDHKEKIFVKTKSDGKYHRADCGSLVLSPEDEVLVEYDQYQEVGIVADKNYSGNFSDSDESDSVIIIRKLTEKDQEIISEKAKEAKETILPCSEKIKKHNLTMDLLDADLSYDGKKLTFYFVAPGRIDFRSLVPDLASTFKKLIRLQQVSLRDKAKCVDGIGRCGRPFCCRSFLKGNLDDITLDMACEQNLGQTGQGRVMGACGKLQCCLKYELDYYKKEKKKLPAVGSKIKTDEGEGIVLSQNVIKESVAVELSKDKRIVEVNC